jgi:hypothetical protein
MALPSFNRGGEILAAGARGGPIRRGGMTPWWRLETGKGDRAKRSSRKEEAMT